MSALSVLFACALGVVLAMVGFTLKTWQFWVIFGLAAAWVLCAILGASSHR